MTGYYGNDRVEPSRYLEEAAALLRKEVEANEQRHRGYPVNLATGRERLARQFAELAAIEMGVLPTGLAHELLDRIHSNNT